MRLFYNNGFFTPSNTKNIKDENYRFFLAAYYSSLVGLFGRIFFLMLFIFIGSLPLALFNVFSITIWFITYLENLKGNHIFALILASLEVVVHAFLSVVFLGWNSGFHVYIIALVPLVFFSPISKKQYKFLESFLLCVIYLALNIYSSNNASLMTLNSKLLNLLKNINILTIFVVLSSLAYYYSMAVNLSEDELKKANCKLKLLSVTDHLTKISNRRGILEALNVDKNSSIILCDIDDFKYFNDTYGHDCGDYVLVTLAHIMKSMLRLEDTIGRWGGEEFLLYLPDTDVQSARLVAERIRKRVESATFSYSGRNLKITMTFGVSSYMEDYDISHSVNKADKALYIGKQNGKNCVSTLF